MTQCTFNEFRDRSRSWLGFRGKRKCKKAFLSDCFVFYLEPGTGFCLFWINKCKTLVTFVYCCVTERGWGDMLRAMVSKE